MGVVDHRCTRLRVLPLPQRRRITRKGERARRARLHDAPPEHRLPRLRARRPPEGDGHPFDEFPAPDRGPGENGGEEPDGCGPGQQYPAAGVEGADDGEDTCGEGDELREGEAEEDAAAGEAGELHRPQPKPCTARVLLSRHRLFLPGRRLR